MAQIWLSGPTTKTDQYIEWYSTPNVIGNYSYVEMYVYLRRNDGYTTTGTFSGSANIDGYTQGISRYGAVAGSYVLIGSYGRNVYHDSNGYRQCWIGASFSNSGTSLAGTYSGGATVTLPSIDRTAPTFTTHSINSVTTTSITVNRVNNVACDQVQYSLNGGAWTSTTTGSTYTITGLTENTSYTIKTRARKTSNQVWGESTTLTQQTHPNTVQIAQAFVTPLGTDTLRVDVVTNATNASSSALTGRVYKIFIEVDGVMQEANQYKHNLGTGQYADAGYYTFTGLTDNTTYVADIIVTTARSLVDTTTTANGTTPPADFARLIYPNGTVTGLKPAYLVSTLGVATRLREVDITVLPPS
jgi:hypothetical protein